MRWRLLAILAVACALPQTLQAEPWIAVQQGMKCGACHVNTSGGGMRNEYGNIYAQMQLAARQLAAADADRWTGRLNGFVAMGGNLRASAQHIDVPNQDTQSLFELDEARLYFNFSPLPNRLDVYLDQRMGPGASANLEAYARLRTADGAWSLKAGRMYLPYGLRLEDDSAFIRSVPGINFNTPDTGFEIGWEAPRWTAQFAVSNGTAGGSENDDGKQASLRLEHVRSAWRFGGSLNVNDTDTGSRNMQNLFAGLRTGPVAWLVEIDRIRDETLAGEALDQRVALLEANWNVRKGHNIKIGVDYFEPDTRLDGDEQNRMGIFWEYFPFEYTQLRVGARFHDDEADIDLQNRSVAVVQVHGYF